MTDSDTLNTLLNPSPTPAQPSGVTREEVRHVAALASLELTAAEEERMQRDLNAILGHIGELNELDTSQVQPLTQISELLSTPTELNFEGAGEANLRADEPRPSLSRRIVMAESPANDGAFFKVPKVIER